MLCLAAHLGKSFASLTAPHSLTQALTLSLVRGPWYALVMLSASDVLAHPITISLLLLLLNLRRGGSIGRYGTNDHQPGCHFAGVYRRLPIRLATLRDPAGGSMGW